MFNTEYSVNWIKSLLGVFIQRRGGELSFGPWFLICLFTTQLIMYFILTYIKGNIKIFIIGMISSILGYLYCVLLGMILPWAIEAALVSILFLIVGYLFKIKESQSNKIFKIRYLPIYFIVNIGSVFIQRVNQYPQIDMYANNYSNYLFFIISSFSGIFLIITIVRNFNLSKQLNFIGRNSLIYYSFHGLILSASERLFNLKFSVEAMKAAPYFFGIINLILCLFILQKLVILLKKYSISSIRNFNYLKINL